MLKNEITKDELFKKLSVVAESLDLYVVDVAKTMHINEIHIAITIYKKNGETGIDDCEQFHKTVQPELELQFGRDELSMEVSTPGIQRAFKDCYEFKVFQNKSVRLYCTSLSSWIIGTIENSDENSVELTNVFIENGNKTEAICNLEYKDIQKAKLDYSFPEKKETT